MAASRCKASSCSAARARSSPLSSSMRRWRPDTLGEEAAVSAGMVPPWVPSHNGELSRGSGLNEGTSMGVYSTKYQAIVLELRNPVSSDDDAVAEQDVVGRDVLARGASRRRSRAG